MDGVSSRFSCPRLSLTSSSQRSRPRFDSQRARNNNRERETKSKEKKERGISMNFVVVFCLVALCLVATSFAKVETEDGVLVVTKDNFESVIQDNDYVLLEFCEYTCSLSSSHSREAHCCFSAELHPLYFLYPGRRDSDPAIGERVEGSRRSDPYEMDPRRKSPAVPHPLRRPPSLVRSLAGSARCEGPVTRHHSSILEDRDDNGRPGEIDCLSPVRDISSSFPRFLPAPSPHPPNNEGICAADARVGTHGGEKKWCKNRPEKIHIWTTSFLRAFLDVHLYLFIDMSIDIYLSRSSAAPTRDFRANRLLHLFLPFDLSMPRLSTRSREVQRVQLRG